MFENKATYLTPQGLTKLQDELRELKGVKRKEIADRILQAKELGDLSENAEYVEAKTEQSFIEGRVLELENMIRNAVVVEDSGDSDTIRIGSVITIKTGSTKLEYHIVGSNEADPANGLISNESPLGSAFLGKHVGDSVPVETPRGTVTYEVVGIQ